MGRGFKARQVTHRMKLDRLKLEIFDSSDRPTENSEPLVDFAGKCGEF
jgi:hypothetical protein